MNVRTSHLPDVAPVDYASKLSDTKAFMVVVGDRKNRRSVPWSQPSVGKSNANGPEATEEIVT